MDCKIKLNEYSFTFEDKNLYFDIIYIYQT